MEDAYKLLKIVPNPDGSLTRLTPNPTQPAAPEIDPANPATTQFALSKDVPLNPIHKTTIRLFRPRNPPENTKLPLILHFHGGGFVFYSASSDFSHHSCTQIAAHIPAVVASVDYRLAPEHRLPAAYDDAIDAVNWAKNQSIDGSDPWIRELVDFSRVYLMGSSAGANIVYHAMLRALDLDLEPLKIVGVIMNQPFFGGVERTKSEITNLDDPVIKLPGTDLLWSLALPEGAGRDHEYCDVWGSGNTVGENIIERLPRCLVRGYEGDPLVDWQRKLAAMLVARGVRVEEKFYDGGCHAVEIFNPKAARVLYDDIIEFIGPLANANL